MKRDNDLMRDLLFRLEDEEDYVSSSFASYMGMSKEQRRDEGHLHLLADAGLISRSGRGGDIYRITNSGHDFLEAVRDDTIWKKTKEAAGDAGGATLKMLVGLATAMLEEKLKNMTGL